MLVLDTAGVPAHQRLSLIADSITTATSATSMTFDGPPEDAHLTLQRWDLGGLEMVDARCSAHTLRRTMQPRSDERTVLAMTCGLKGHGVNQQDQHEVPVRPASLWATDLSVPHVHQVSDTRTITTKIPLDQLGIPRHLVRPALQRAGTSPLAPLFRHHVVEVRRVADQVTGAAALALGTSTLALARALLASITNDERLWRESQDDVLLVQVRAFVREHLCEPSLSPATIAAAHHVSVRHLYKICARANIRLEQWIFEERLERAHEELARVGASGLSVSEVARRWGFRNSSHFARRFRIAYGMSPREWRASSREARAQTDRD